ARPRRRQIHLRRDHGDEPGRDRRNRQFRRHLPAPPAPIHEEAAFIDTEGLARRLVARRRPASDSGAAGLHRYCWSAPRRRRLNPFAETCPHRFAGYSASGVAPRAFARGPAPPCGVAGSTRLRKLALTDSPAIPPPGSPPAHSRGAPLHPAASYSVKAISLTTAPGRRMLLTLRAR